MNYQGEYFYPPRTKNRIPYTDSPVLKMWRKFPDAIAQFKENGNRNLVKVTPNRDIEFWNRHRERQKYTIPNAMRAAILDISPPGHYTVWDTELIHFKTKDVKDTLYFFDCLVWESTHLVGMTYGERYKLVEDRVHRIMPLDPLDISKEDPKVFRAQMIPVSGWDSAWRQAKDFSHIEGLVLKRTGGSSRLEAGAREENNGGFMCRVRKFNKNMNF